MGRQEKISKELQSVINGVLEIAYALKADPTAASKFDIEKYRDLADIPIEELGLSVRPYNVLLRSGFGSLGSVCALTWDELSHLHGMGKHSAEEVLKKLAEHGLKLRARNAENKENTANTDV